MLNIAALIRAKRGHRKWTVLTAYDALWAELVWRSGVDWILVGDSLGMVVLGYPTTRQVTMAQMLHHVSAVRRGAPKATVIADMPLKGVQNGAGQALASAKRFVKEGGADAVKIEWSAAALDAARRITRAGIPVMGHVGLTPQTVKSRAGFKVQATTAAQADEVLAQAKAFERAGAFSVLLECVPSPVARRITRELRVPTIGIGAGRGCDGQVLVLHDLLGLFMKFRPRFVKRYAELGLAAGRAIRRYAGEVRSGKFPSRRFSYGR